MLFYGFRGVVVFFSPSFCLFSTWFMNISVIILFLLEKHCFLLQELQHVSLKCKYSLQGTNKFCATKSLWFLHLIMSHWIIIILFLLVSPTQSSILFLHLIKSASFAARLLVKLRLTHREGSFASGGILFLTSEAQHLQGSWWVNFCSNIVKSDKKTFPKCQKVGWGALETCLRWCPPSTAIQTPQCCPAFSWVLLLRLMSADVLQGSEIKGQLSWEPVAGRVLG